MKTLDANEAVAAVSYLLSDVIALFPITPASPMGEWADTWAAAGRKNIWGLTPQLVEMQSEAGAAGALHGASQAGALATTYTASQGLLLMIPELYKLAGELSPVVLHVAARSLATHGLSIFGDHSDVMAVRQTGAALLASASVQEANDLALIAHLAALRSRLPFIHFFDGFRTSHQIEKIDPITAEQVLAMLRPEWVEAHRGRALSPEHPFIRGTAHNPDTYFQAREAANPFYQAAPGLVQQTMDEFARQTGRAYHLFDYEGAADAETVMLLMGSGAGPAQEVVEALNQAGGKTGLIQARLYRPFDASALRRALPKTAHTVIVLDRTKEPGGGDPLYLDAQAALAETGAAPRLLAGRYGLGSKEFTPGMVKATFEEAARANPRRHFTLGIDDDVSHESLSWDADYSLESEDTFRAVFFGLGSDGTVGANKNTIKIIGEGTENYAQGYFIYDSKKSGSLTVSHLRFGPRPIRSSYLIRQANFVACHVYALAERADVLALARPGGVFLLNAPHAAAEIWDRLPRTLQRRILELRLRFFVIDANALALELGLGSRINTILQSCFFAISGVIPRERAQAAMRETIRNTYRKRGPAVVEKNLAAIEAALARLHEVTPGRLTSTAEMQTSPAAAVPGFVGQVTARLLAGEGDLLPVSAFPADGTWPSGTTRWEKRNLAARIPAWEPALCIQCGKCVLVCPHAAIRAQVYEPARLEQAPAGFLSMAAHWREFDGYRYSLQVAPEDCTGCTLCVAVCPAHDKKNPEIRALGMEPQAPRREAERRNWEFFLTLPSPPKPALHLTQIKDLQLAPPLFEFSGACSGCGETPYLKMLTQLYGDRLMIANATGCSSIYGGNLPTTPWATDAAGRGPAWSNSLFEDNAEFGLGLRMGLDHQTAWARELLSRLAARLPEALVGELQTGVSSLDEAGFARRREAVAQLRRHLAQLEDVPDAKRLMAAADALTPKIVWLVGGDGWAYDIGYGGLDHVLANSSNNVKILVLDTEVYSNTGGQMSKSTPRGAIARFAEAGKREAKKDLALLALSYEHVYVARVAFGGNDLQTLRALREAGEYPGPALVLAYAHCIAHGYELEHGLEQQKAAVLSGYWPLFRYHPDRRGQANAFELDSRPPSLPLTEYLKHETRFARMTAEAMDGEATPEAETMAHELLREAQEDILRRWQLYARLAAESKAAAAADKTVPAGAASVATAAVKSPTGGAADALPGTPGKGGGKPEI